MGRVILNPFNQRRENEVAIRKLQLFKSIIVTCLIMSSYFFFSVGLTFYQRWFIQKFRYPLTVVCCHLILKYIIASVIRWMSYLVLGRKRVSVNCHDCVTKFIPIGFAAGLDIAFSNWGLELNTVSIYTMTKSSSIIFLLLFALFLRLERKGCCICVIVFMISGGLLMFTYKSVQFHIKGFILILIASFASGLRWTLSQLAMEQQNLGIKNPIDMMYHIQLWMITIVLPFSFTFEVQPIIQEWQSDSASLWNGFLLALVGGVIAFMLELNEFLVVSRTSSLTLSVGSIFKEVLSVVLAVNVNGDKLTVINIIGLVMCLCGIVTHVVYKAQNMKHNFHSQLVTDEASALFLPFQVDSSEWEHDDLEVDDDDNSSTEVLFSVIQNRDWPR